MADHRSCDLIIDSVQLESSPSVLSSVETIASLVLLVLPNIPRHTKSQEADRHSAMTPAMCVQATNLNLFLCCENSGQCYRLLISDMIASVCDSILLA